MVHRHLIAIALTLLALPALSYASPGTTGGQLLELIPDARTSAMGESFCGIANDASAVQYNPAGLAQIDYTAVPAASSRMYEGMNHQYLGIVCSLRDVRTENVERLGTIAATLATFNSGDIVGRDALGNENGVFRSQDQLFTVSYGRALYQEDRVGQIMAGGNAKFLTEELKDEKTYNVVFDVGLLWLTPVENVSLGMTAQNMGGPLGYRTGQVTAPSNIKAGVGYRALEDDLLLGADVNKPSDAALRFSFGGEYLVLDRTIALRLGYNPVSGEGSGLTAGLGLSLREVDVLSMFLRGIEVDYAFLPYGELGSIQKLSLTLKFGAD